VRDLERMGASQAGSGAHTGPGANLQQQHRAATTPSRASPRPHAVQIGKQLPASITVHNPTGDRVAFKVRRGSGGAPDSRALQPPPLTPPARPQVKTTTPKKYVVRPSAVRAGHAAGEARSAVRMRRAGPGPPATHAAVPLDPC
jgi:hypothetical protein